MKPFSIAPEDVTLEAVVGRVLCHDITAVGDAGRVRIGKGKVLSEEHVSALQTFSGEIHLIEMESDDVHEDEASLRLARAVAGEGIELKGPVESQTQLVATHRGLLTVEAGILEELNSVPDVSVFTAYDGQPVTAGKVVGATKVTPLVVAGSALSCAEHIAANAGPAVEVHPFLQGKVGVVVRDRLSGKARDKFEAAIHMKLSWFSSPVAGISYLPESVESIAEAINNYVSEGTSLVLAGGVNSTDPLDLTIQALDLLHARTERRGVPAHPGSTCWLAYVEDTPVFGLALCGMFSKTTVLDLLLPRFLSGHAVTAGDLATLGHGGLLSREMAFRFPAY